MGNFLENVIEKLINDGLITESELQNRIDEAKAKSPVNDLNNIANVESVQMQMINDLGSMVSGLLMQNMSLENRILELEEKSQ